MSDVKQAQNIQVEDIAIDADFEILETTEATALEEMGASTTVAASSTCCEKVVIS